MIAKAINDSNFRGNVNITQNSKVLFESMTGYADFANKLPNTLETKFASASAGKVFVVVGILQLIENGKIRHNSDLLPLFTNKPMMYQKGEKFQYNNSGYVLLAMIIKQVTELDFDQYIKKNVFDPLSCL